MCCKSNRVCRSNVRHMVKKGYRYDIAILRLLCAVAVVFFHAYGIMYAMHFSDETRQLYANEYWVFNQSYFICITMAMFVFISGFLFGGQLIRRRPISLKNIVRTKFLRLMVPFFVFTTLFMCTQNAVSLSPYYKWTYMHLWFLPMLFWCFIISYFFRQLILSDNWIVSILTLATFFCIPILGVDFPSEFGLVRLPGWFCWFVLGMWFCKHEDQLTLQNTSALFKVIVIVSGLAIYFVADYFYPTFYGESTFKGIITTMLGIYALWILFYWIPWQDFYVTDFLLSLSACSFGIYIFHYWLEAHMVSRTAQRLFPLECWAHDHYRIFPVVFALTAIIISYVITWVILRFKIGRKLLG